MFCEGCREFMEKDPVPEDAVVLIPRRENPDRRVNRKGSLSTDEKLELSQRKVKRLRALTILLLLLLGFSIGSNAYLLNKNKKPAVGQNYSTVTSTAPSHGLPVTSYDRISRGAVAYKEMAEEVARKL